MNCELGNGLSISTFWKRWWRIQILYTKAVEDSSDPVLPCEKKYFPHMRKTVGALCYSWLNVIPQYSSNYA